MKFEMNSSYMLDFFTLINSDGKQNMVRVMDYKEAQRDHVSYIDYVNKTNTKEHV